MNKKRHYISLTIALSLSFWGCDQASTNDQVVTEQQVHNDTTTTAEAPKNERTKTIVFFGNSLTAGYGLEPDQAFPALLQERIDSLGLPYKAVNAGLSGETSAGGKSRIDWLLKQPIDVFVLELGANDGLRGIDPASTYDNLATIIDKVRAQNPEAVIILAGMQMPPSMGQRFTKEFEQVYTRLSNDKDVALIPFLLEGVAGDRALNQGDGIHPTIEGQRILADNVWEVLEPILVANRAS
ncbi:arylesterase [Pontibacter ramchanderi]|uniref:Acyl-CoA thioesterase-1 n=1 Tax=Pontibacter ramchanderi TaxID=1179743 RepID=A0A2N3V1P6_9BACT|nr:arylesterase [Pontibacter ramchanderi]PKV75544.1 acyl-CoA thioesterase-1 [Pontibacter ramchanderi]